MQSGVGTATRDQFLTATGLDDAALLQDNNLINVMNRGQAMRDHKRGAVAH